MKTPCSPIPGSRLSRWPSVLLCVAALVLSAMRGVKAEETVVSTLLTSFDPIIADSPGGTLTEGRDGNFYGTTFAGGANDFGTVFKLTPTGTRTTLHEFARNDGINPSTRLVQGADGNFYGTTFNGGPADASGNVGRGGVYKITPDGVLTVLSTFHGVDGRFPTVDLLAASDGNFYGGITFTGTANSGGGALFKITPTGTLTIVHRFEGSGGSGPTGRLVQDGNGTIYGTTRGGGANGGGTVYSLSPDGTQSLIYQFGVRGEGQSPTELLLGRDGNFYVITTSQITGNGVNDYTPQIFRITPAGVPTVLRTFTSTDDSYNSANSLVQGDNGNIYGVTYGTDISTDEDPDGAFFRITPAGTFESLYSFRGSGTKTPNLLLLGRDGNFYATTSKGGANDTGAVVKLALTSTPAFFSGAVALADGVYYLAFPGNGNIFGYYEYLSDPRYIYHFDLGFEYVFDLGNGGVVFYDFASNDYFYTSPTFPFPYLYDFGLQAFLYYYPDPTNPQRYNTNGVRYFYNFNTGQTIVK